MRVLVTGHNGFIGRAVSHELMERGHWVRLFIGDVRDEAAVARQVWHNDVIVHLAGKTPGGNALDMDIFTTNFSGSLVVAKACREAGLPMIFASTRVRESWYGRSKWMAESVLMGEFGERVTPVRVSMAYGPGQQMPPPYGDGKIRLVPKWVCAALSGDPVCIYGDETTVPDLVYIDDVAEAYADTVELLGKRPRQMHLEPLEVAGPGKHTLQHISLLVATEVKAQVGLGTQVIHFPGDHPSPPPGEAGVGTPLTTGLRRTVLYYRGKLAK